MQAFLDTFLFGAANSLHCVGMCGPLAACVLGPTGASVVGTAAAYHTGRAAAYAAAGAVAGSLGAGIGAESLDTPAAWIGILLATGLLLQALGAHHVLGQMPGSRALSALMLRGHRHSLRLPPGQRAAALGAMTPLLPCGLLFSVYPAAMLTGSWYGGALAMGGFAAGSLPALALAQLNLRWLRGAVRPDRRAWLQRTLLLAAAAMLLWRATVSLQGGSCCHA